MWQKNLQFKQDLSLATLIDMTFTALNTLSSGNIKCIFIQIYFEFRVLELNVGNGVLNIFNVWADEGWEEPGHTKYLTL